jgi:hypothetical protein
MTATPATRGPLFSFRRSAAIGALALLGLAAPA